ncbi:MAG: alkaline phosphatase D family protein [Pseudomonadota bacterium]
MTTFKTTRRGALAGTAALSAAACAGAPYREAFVVKIPQRNDVFAHGVASGDPAADSVVLWTRASVSALGAVPVTWEVAEDAEFTKPVARGVYETSAARDYTVKVVAEGLAPGTTYYYRFRTGDAVSPSGRTRTLPEGSVEQLKFAVMSCSNYPFGYFNAYDHIARRTDLNAVIHLGDYIYEYGPNGYGAEVGKRLGREHNPPKEIITLEDYRLRHAQYKSDAGSQAMLAAHPLIALWDDHETANNTWADGAENHDPGEGEGPWRDRLAAAMQAYYEWMPVRDPRPGKTRQDLYRAFEFGDLMTLATIETRLTARSLQLEYADIVPTLKTPEDIENFRKSILGAEDRMMIGAEQERYLSNALSKSVEQGKTWRMVGNQIIMAQVLAADLSPYIDEEAMLEIEKDWDGIRAFVEFSKLGLPLNLDAWDGYPAARERFYDMARTAGASDLLVVTGDTHTWWANDLATEAGDSMGIEFGTSAVSSPGAGSFLGERSKDLARLINRDNESVRYYSGDTRGYIALTLDADGRGSADFVALSTVESPEYEAYVLASFGFRKANGTIEFDRIRHVPVEDEALFKYDFVNDGGPGFWGKIGLAL